MNEGFGLIISKFIIYNVIKAINAAVAQIFIITAAPKALRVYVGLTILFWPRSYVFVLNLTESLLKSVKIALKKIVKSILRNRKTINSSKNSFGKKWHCKEWFAHAIACTARADDNNNNTHLFPLLSVNKFKKLLLHLRYKTHG